MLKDITYFDISINPIAINLNYEYNEAIKNDAFLLEREDKFMRSKSPELMKRICTFVDTFYRSEGSSPSLSEIAKGVGIAKTTAYRYLVDMNERGMISYDGHTIETPLTDKCISGYFSAPIVGYIRCGDPETEEEQVEEYVSLPESIFGKGDFYLLRATGDSMVDAGIEDKDLIVIQKQKDAFVGDIVVALDDNNQNTLKTFAGIDEKSGYAILRYENNRKYSGKEIRVRKLVVQGVAKHVIKAL